MNCKCAYTKGEYTCHRCITCGLDTRDGNHSRCTPFKHNIGTNCYFHRPGDVAGINSFFCFHCRREVYNRWGQKENCNYCSISFTNVRCNSPKCHACKCLSRY